ncbi:MAG: hypothetical protein RR037_02680 [Alistipes sp.]
MANLITPQQAITLAFTDGEYLPAETISETLITAAEERHLVPVMGQVLYARLIAGAYPDLKSLAAPAAALFTRLLLQPNLNIRTGRFGTTAPRSSSWEPAAEQSLNQATKALRRQAALHLRRLSRHLDAHSADYPEYDPDTNILHHCTIHGDLIQTF